MANFTIAGVPYFTGLLGGVTLTSSGGGGGRRWTFPAVPPEADHEFPAIKFDEITRPDASSVNVASGRTLHKITMTWLLAYPDDRSIEPDLMELRQFSNEGKWFTINYTPSWGGWWLLTEPIKVSQSMLNTANEITQATITLVLKRATQIAAEITPVKAKGSADIPIIQRVEVAATAPGLDLNKVQYVDAGSGVGPDLTGISADTYGYLQ